MKWTVALAVAAASVCLASAQSRVDCPDGWVNFSDDVVAPTCLHFRRSKDTWQGTRDYCQALGADLAKLTTDLHGKVVRYIFDLSESDLDDEAFWIGGSDEDEEGSWKWVTDNTVIPMGPPQWFLCDNQPSGGQKKNCLCIFTPDFYFHSCTCDYTYFGICEI